MPGGRTRCGPTRPCRDNRIGDRSCLIRNSIRNRPPARKSPRNPGVRGVFVRVSKPLWAGPSEALPFDTLWRAIEADLARHSVPSALLKQHVREAIRRAGQRDELVAELAKRDALIAELEAELARLTGRLIAVEG